MSEGATGKRDERLRLPMVIREGKSNHAESIQRLQRH